ncbi:MAG: hypothetical protein GXP19_06565 [Gammaproteobacteria bacterium]|nr:hypothetical protein [Gammaproteobacteria bacterium]
MQKPVIIIGVGEMGGVFARGFLRRGYPVYPVTREMNLISIAPEIPDPALVLVAVGEHDLHATLDTLPENWHNKLTLLQNELLPRDWQAHKIEQPTVISVWFEKKKGQDYKVIIPSPVYGEHSEIIATSLMSIDIPCTQIQEKNEMLYELVRKNVYILTTNIAGLAVGGTVEDLWTQHNELAYIIANEVIQLQQWITGETLPSERLIKGMEEAIRGDLNHKCMGRSAPARLNRAISLADEAELAVPKLRDIAKLNSPGK